MRIALLEDDVDQGRLLQETLKKAGHKCELYHSGRTFVQQVRRESHDVYVLDWVLPEMSGMDVLNWVRENIEFRVPVLFVTSKENEDDVVRALEAGADDYMTKPVKSRELLARLAALARRTATVDESQQVFEFEPFTIDRNSRTVMRDGEPVELTQKEYELIVFLFRNLGRVMSRGHILETVWGRNPNINTRTVDTHVSRIRTKLGINPECGWRLSSIYQHGYRLEKVSVHEGAAA